MVGPPELDSKRARLASVDTVVGPPELDSKRARLASVDTVVGPPELDSKRARLAIVDTVVGTSVLDSERARLSSVDTVVGPPELDSERCVTEVDKMADIIVDQVATNELLDRLVGVSPTAEIEIGGVAVGCVLDTGAEASLLPAWFYHQHLTGMVTGLDNVGTFVKVVGANDLEVPIEGFLEVPIKETGASTFSNLRDKLGLWNSCRFYLLS